MSSDNSFGGLIRKLGWSESDDTSYVPFALGMGILGILLVIVAVVVAVIIHIYDPAGYPVSSSGSLATVTICPAATRVPVYLFTAANATTIGNTDIVSAKTGWNVALNAAVQFELCSFSFQNAVPLYMYTDVGELNISYGFSPAAPSGSFVSNNGLPLGYLSQTHTVGTTTLTPIYILQATFTAGTLSLSYQILSPLLGVTLAGQPYISVGVAGYAYVSTS